MYLYLPAACIMTRSFQFVNYFLVLRLWFFVSAQLVSWLFIQYKNLYLIFTMGNSAWHDLLMQCQNPFFNLFPCTILLPLENLSNYHTSVWRLFAKRLVSCCKVCFEPFCFEPFCFEPFCCKLRHCACRIILHLFGCSSDQFILNSAWGHQVIGFRTAVRRRIWPALFTLTLALRRIIGMSAKSFQFGEYNFFLSADKTKNRHYQ